MYSVIDTNGFQQKVTLGETLKVPKIDAEPGSDFTFSKVLLHSGEKEVTVGTPNVEDANVVVEILAHGKSDKVKVFKKKRRKGYRRTQGHRQDFTEVIVKEISAGSDKKSADDKVVARARQRAVAIKALKEDQKKADKNQNAAQEEKAEEK